MFSPQIIERFLDWGFMLEFLQKGGWPVMSVLLVLSVYALAVFFYKIFQFYTAGVFNNQFVEPVMADVKKGELTFAEQKLLNARGPVATVMKVAIACITNRHMSQKSREAEISRVGSAELRNLESHMRGMEMAGNVGPLLGLLGTVIGMIDTFKVLGKAGSRVDPAMLAGGIWEALISTVAGLSVAIPAVMIYYLLDGIIEKVRATMRDVTVQIMALEDEFIRNEKEQDRREMLEQERRLREQQESLEKAMEQQRTTPQSSSTLRLLSPSYIRF